MRKNINVNFHTPSQTWGIMVFNKMRGRFIDWGASSPWDCRNLPGYHD